MRIRFFITTSLLGVCALAGCQSAPTGPELSNPQSFQDLLTVTDTTQLPVCTLPLEVVRQNMSETKLEAAMTAAFDYDALGQEYKNDPVTQISVIFRRAALKRRMSVKTDETAAAQGYYDSFDNEMTAPQTLTQFHDGFHYWMDRIAEQGDYGDTSSPDYNLRFCVMNERRAVLHAASRADILRRVEAGVQLPNPDLIENINHETSFDDGFVDKTMAQIYTTENSASLKPLGRAKMRGNKPFLPFDAKYAAPFWEARDTEISVVLNHIETHNFTKAADKLGQMSEIDQSLRKLLGGSEAENHFENTKEFEAFKDGVYQRMTKVDEFNTAQLQSMLEGRGWFRDDKDGRGAGFDAWLIAQHADRNPEFQIEVLKLIETELGAPGVSKSNYAYLYDRVQMRERDEVAFDKRVQRYGTQGRCTGPATWAPFPVEQPDMIDAVRAEVGLGSMADYKTMFKDMCKEDQR